MLFKIIDYQTVMTEYVEIEADSRDDAIDKITSHKGELLETLVLGHDYEAQEISTK